MDARQVRERHATDALKYASYPQGSRNPSFTRRQYFARMDTDLTSQLLAARSTGTQHSATIAVIKKNYEMDMALLQAVDTQSRAAPPPGQGVKVDKLA